MGFWKNMTTAFRGAKTEKEEAENTIITAPADIDNLKIGAFITFGFLPLQEELSGKTMEITSNRVFKLLNNETITYAELDHGAFYIRKEKNKIEVLKECENIDAFLECIDDAFHDVLELEDDEWEYEGDLAVVKSNQTEFNLIEDFEFASKGTYRTVKDVMSGKFNNQPIRYIRSKSSDGKSIISLFYMNSGGETFISTSCFLSLSDIEFAG